MSKSITEVLTSYALILEKTSSLYSSKKEILDKLRRHDINKTERSLQNYLRELKEIGVEFDEKKINRVSHYKWKYGTGDTIWLNLIETAIYKNRPLSPIEQNVEIPYIITESEHVKVEYLLLRKLIDSIKKTKTLIFLYQKIEDIEPSRVVFSPYLLKKYNNLWYVIGFSHNKNEIRTYALDRVKQLIGDSEEQYNDERKEYVFQKIRNCIGVSLLQEPIFHITYEVAKSQWYYLQVSPIHPTQQKIEETDDTVIFSVEVIDNYELQQKIAWCLGTVKEISRQKINE